MSDWFMDEVRKRVEEKRKKRRSYFRLLSKGVGFSFKTPIKHVVPINIAVIGRGTKAKSIGRKRARDEKVPGNVAKDNHMTGLQLGRKT